MNFEFYVMNESRYGGYEIEPFNIFSNYYVNEMTEKAIKKYLRAPNKYKRDYEHDKKYKDLVGFDALVREISKIIMYEEWSRCEYEIAVGSLFTTEIRDIVRKLDEYTTLEKLKEDLIKESNKNKPLKKIDCFMQAEPNMKMIVHECIRQYKEQLRKGNNNDNN